ncbi:MAG TPA: bifunctional folylpolyglutamate synthase/dihydrofolate synthase [Clostridiales bacterium]|nr:bifunctional folylpolyglutamate synthase/dihydrofolate synthase [Clostridiales bacterium]
MTYEEALKYIHDTNRFGIKCGLRNVSELLKRLDNPQDKFKSIHIAGTNGKGSTAAMLAYVLKKQGYKVGMFTSPYLEDFRERIQVNLELIDKDALARITTDIKNHIDKMILDGYDHPTEFEIVTAIGFTYFAEQKVDYAVVETGLGGRLDATNVINPVLTIITSISYDHMNILGDSIESIAFEKAGIIKPNTPVVIYPQIKEVFSVLSDIARKKNAIIYNVADAKFDMLFSEFGLQKFNFTYGEWELDTITIHLTGKHQILNAITVLTAIFALNNMGITISDIAVIDGLASTKWPGRLEKIRTNPDIIIDGAHNEASAKILADTIKQYYGDRRIILVIGILKDKEVNKILKSLCPISHTVIVTSPNNPRAMEPHKLSQIAGMYCDNILVANRIDDAIRMAEKMVKSNDIIVFSGSIYLIGEVRKFLKYE